MIDSNIKLDENVSNILNLLLAEETNQESNVSFIASENYASTNVLTCCGSCAQNKYAEGLPGKRYYAGCDVVDLIETNAIDLACKLFNCEYANVQPHSGASANLAVLKALVNPGDTILGMSLEEGGHLTHGASPTISGAWFKAVQYGITDDGIIDYDGIRTKLNVYNPRLLIVGASAYPREIDFAKIKAIVDEYNEAYIEELQALNPGTYEELFEKFGCYYMVDMAHIAGLVASNEHMSPIPYADVVTSTCHKTLRGARGGLILTNDLVLSKKIDKAVFPGCQGGPLENMIAGKAMCFAEALQPSFKEYIQQVKKNIKAMEEVFNQYNIPMISGGSDNHLLLLDLTNFQISGKLVERVLATIGIITNKNAIKNEKKSKFETSGLRIGTAAITTRGATEQDCKIFANIISRVIIALSKDGALTDSEHEQFKDFVKMWCNAHTIYRKEN